MEDDKRREMPLASQISVIASWLLVIRLPLNRTSTPNVIEYLVNKLLALATLEERIERNKD